MISDMEVAIIGPGSVGGYLTAKLKNSGNRVSVVARGKTLEIIRKKGITVTTGGETISASPDLAVEKISDIGEADLIILGVKAGQISGILGEISPAVGDNTTILPVQNGVEAWEMVRRKFNGHTLGGFARMINVTEEPGRIKNLGGEVSVTMGEENGQNSKRVQEISGLFRESGIDTYVSRNIRKSIWEKFLIMANLGGIGAVVKAPVGNILSVARTRDMLMGAIMEVINVGKAQGIPLDCLSRKKAWDFITSLPPDSTTAFQRDVMAGRPSELEYMSGAVTRIGIETCVETPIHEFIYSALLPGEILARQGKNSH